MKFIFLYIIPFVFLSATTCTNDDGFIACTEDFRYGLSVTLVDSSNSSIITSNVEVTATDMDYNETLMLFVGSNTFVGAGERAGNYILTVTSDNYQTFTSDVITLTSDECHVIEQSIEISLIPN